MIAYVYNLPSWISNPDNKPSFNLWQIILNNNISSKIECKTISQPTLTSLFIQSSYSINNWYKYNYVNFNDLWYIIDTVNYVSDNNQVVEINCHIDIYLSFIVKYFDENNSITKPVFFIQKHLNRWLYNTNESTTYINFSNQFYLKNKHQGLSGIGQLTQKTVDVVTDYLYNGAKMQGQTASNEPTYPITPISQSTFNNNSCIGYLYFIWKMTSSEHSQTQINQFSTMGLMNVTGNTYNQSFYVVQLPIGNPPSGTSYNDNKVITCIPWWYAVTTIGSDAYVDLITLPVPVELAVIYTAGLSGLANFMRILPTYNTNNTTINEIVSCLYNYAKNSVPNDNIIVDNLSAQSILIYNVVPQNLYYFFSEDPNNTNNCKQIANIYDIEPYIFQYCSFRVRGGGEDAVLDITAFNNFTPQYIIYTLYSFCINMNHPVTQITNIHYDMLQHALNIFISENYANNNWWIEQTLGFCEPYGYNTVSDAWYTLNWKSTYPSTSSNWNNYLLQNLNNYHMGLSIAQFNMQASQSAVAFDAIKAWIGMGTAAATGLGATTGADVSNFVGDASVSSSMGGLVGDIGSLTNGVFNMETQEQKYQYLLHGKKGDMSRTSNERLSVSNNAISYNNFALTFIFENPVYYEQLACINFCMLNGYILERWEPFNYWYNRIYCNFVKIAYFTDSICPLMNKTYKNLIDGVLNNGIRIWTSANTSYDTIPFSNVIYQYTNSYTNIEVNQNNNEINFLNGD